MADYIDVKYVLLYSSNLQRFTDKGNHVYNFRCTECGDSEKNKTKTRGYIHETDKGKMWYYCQNCNHSTPFDKYLKEKDFNLYSAYMMEKFGLSKDQLDRKISTPFPTKLFDYDNDEAIKLKLKINKAFSGLSSVWFAGLNPDPLGKEVLSIVEKRQIPKEASSDLYYTDDFKGFTNSLIPGKFKETDDKEPRLIIPIRDIDSAIIGYQGRSLPSYTKERLEKNPEFLEIRYITIMLDKTKPRIWGLNKVDFNYKHFVLEGPIDAMCLPNAIATAGGAILSELDKLGAQKENTVIIFDNEPRNKQICDQIHKAVVRNYKIFIWPSWIRSKDVNQFITEEGTLQVLLDTIEENTYNGLSAELEFKAWRKC